MLEYRDDLVLPHRGVGRNQTRLDGHVIGALLHPGDEPNSVAGEIFKPSVIVVATVENDDRAGIEAQPACDVNLMGLALADMGEAGQVAVMIEQHMDLDGALGAAKGGPIVQAEAEVDDGGVERDQCVLEAKRPLALRRQPLAAGQKLLEDGLIKLPGPMSVGVRERATRRSGFQTQVLQLPFGSGQPLGDLAQAVRAPQLAKQHGDELSPTAKTARASLGLVLAHGQFELATREQLQKLTKNAAYSIHGGFSSYGRSGLLRTHFNLPEELAAQHHSGPMDRGCSRTVIGQK